MVYYTYIYTHTQTHTQINVSTWSSFRRRCTPEEGGEEGRIQQGRGAGQRHCAFWGVCVSDIKRVSDTFLAYTGAFYPSIYRVQNDEGEEHENTTVRIWQHRDENTNSPVIHQFDGFVFCIQGRKGDNASVVGKNGHLPWEIHRRFSID